MGLKLSNNAISRLASAIASGDTSISVASGEGAKFPTLGAGDYFPATLSKSDGSYEIVNVTARSGDTLTAVRAREGTTALDFDANALIELRLTALTIETITAKLDGIAPGATNVTDTSQLTNGAGYVTSYGSVAYATNAGAVTNGVYTTGSYANPAWITSLDYSKLTGTVPTWNQNTTGNAGTVTNGVYTNANAAFGTDIHHTYGPNTSWGAYLRVGGNGRTVSGSLYASIAVTDGNLHIDAGDAKALYLNYYAGTSGINFGNGASGTMGTMTSAGNLTMNGNITAYSDERIKRNWRSVTDDFVAKLAQIKSGIYDRIDIEATQAGVSAQSFRTLLPETVNEDDKGRLSVAYGNAALVAAVELAKEIVALRKELELLKAN